MTTLRRSWSWLVGAAILAGVVWWAGLDPFVTGVRSLDAGTLLLGAALGVPITVASAWRWRLVARGLGVELPLGPATAAYYRSQFLNSVLPGGVLGDVLRGVDHGRAAGDPARGLRAVAWERTAGQVVQGAITVLALAMLPSAVRPWVVAVFAVLVVGVVLLVALGRTWTTLRSDLAGLAAQRVWPGVALASAVAVVGLAATYVLAARAVGATAPLATLVPLALLVLVVAAVPANLAGWGPREGAAGWAFAAAGLGADQGIATSVAFGVLVLVASLPGAVVLLTQGVGARAGHPAPRAVAGRGTGG